MDVALENASPQKGRGCRRCNAHGMNGRAPISQAKGQSLKAGPRFARAGGRGAVHGDGPVFRLGRNPPGKGVPHTTTLFQSHTAQAVWLFCLPQNRKRGM